VAELNIKNLVKSYGSYTVLAFDKWELKDGLYWIKGGNGTGKTTLFKVIAGQTPFDGEVSINGISLRKRPSLYRSLLSFAEAEPQYPSFITGTELLDFYCKVRKTTRKSTDELIEQFKMGDSMNNKISSYSSGMLKKLSLICAFTGNIEFYLLDEPLITIDAASAQVLYECIKNRRQEGATFMISTHQEMERTAIEVDGTFEINQHKLSAC